MRSDLDRLLDAHDHASHALALMQRRAVTGVLERDRFQSLLFDLMVIGTTLGQVSRSVLGLAQDVPWRNVIATRNRIVHAYWHVDGTLLSDIVTVEDLERLVLEFADLIAIMGLAEP